MNKKAQAATAIYMAVFVIVCGMLFFFFLIILDTQSKEMYQIPAGLEQAILKERFLENCFGEQEILSGHYSQGIAWDNFDQEHLNECYDIAAGSEYLGFRLRLEYNGKEKAIQTRNWRGEAARTRVFDVLIDGEGGRLLIEVQDAQ